MGSEIDIFLLSDGGRSMKTGAEGGQEQRQNFGKIPQPAAIVNSLIDEDFGR